MSRSYNTKPHKFCEPFADHRDYFYKSSMRYKKFLKQRAHDAMRFKAMPLMNKIFHDMHSYDDMLLPTKYSHVNLKSF